MGAGQPRPQFSFKFRFQQIIPPTLAHLQLTVRGCSWPHPTSLSTLCAAGRWGAGSHQSKQIKPCNTPDLDLRGKPLLVRGAKALGCLQDCPSTHSLVRHARKIRISRPTQGILVVALFVRAGSPQFASSRSRTSLACSWEFEHTELQRQHRCRKLNSCADICRA